MSAIFNETHLSLGEGADETDIIDLQRRASALVLDGLIREQLRISKFDRSVGPTTGVEDAALAADGFAGLFIPTVNARQFSNFGGMIFKHDRSVAGPIGSAPKTLPYYLGTDELLTTVAIGSAGGDRIDSLFGQITEVVGGPQTRHFEDAAGNRTTQTTNKKRTWTLATQLVQGTVGAGVPAQPAGRWFRLCSIYVPMNHNAVITAANLWDERWPVRFRPIMQLPAAGWVGAGSWTIDGNGRAQSAAAGNNFYFSPAVSGHHGTARLRKLRFRAKLSATAIVRLVRIDMTTGGWTMPLLRTITPALPFDGEATYTVDSGPAATTGPIWTNGFPCPGAEADATSNAARQVLGLEIVAGAALDYISYVEWETLE